MRASIASLAVALALGACNAGDKPTGPEPDAARPDFGATMETCTFDGAVPTNQCSTYTNPDGGAPFPAMDLGPEPGDLGPVVAPDLDAARPDLGTEPPGFNSGCVEIDWCLSPVSTSLTYENFARDFFGAYCVRCHSTRKVGSTARHGAIPCYDWDDEASVRAHLGEIRDQACRFNAMPFDRPEVVPCERRRQLAEWIDNGAP